MTKRVKPFQLPHQTIIEVQITETFNLSIKATLKHIPTLDRLLIKAQK